MSARRKSPRKRPPNERGIALILVMGSITLLTVFFWIPIVLSRPFVLWKALLVGAMIGLAVLAFVVPVASAFFNFDAPAPLVWQSLAVGLVGAAGVEAV